MPNVHDIDPFSPEVIENPHEFFAALRREAPLYELPNGSYYLISRMEDVKRATQTPEVFSSNLMEALRQDARNVDFSGDSARPSDVLATADPPRHTRQRRVSNRAFTMRRVNGMEPRIRELATQLIAPFLERRGGDWVKGFAVPLPMTIITELLGLPLADIAQLKRWSDASTALLSGINSPEEQARCARLVSEMFDYLSAHFEHASKAPGDDVLGDLVRASLEDAEHFSHDEAVSTLVQLLTAGNETTTSLIGSAVWLLLREPGLQQTLRANPQKIEPFIEEVLRLESPFHGHFRITRRDTEVAGHPLPAGSRVMLLWSAANRDGEHYAEPDTINLDRPAPKQHVAFGYGIHFCIGAALARMEARVALETLLKQTSELRLATDNDFAHVPSLFIRSLKRLELDLLSA